MTPKPMKIRELGIVAKTHFVCVPGSSKIGNLCEDQTMRITTELFHLGIKGSEGLHMCTHTILTLTSPDNILERDDTHG